VTKASIIEIKTWEKIRNGEEREWISNRAQLNIL
jgi:hypothetical protein